MSILKCYNPSISFSHLYSRQDIMAGFHVPGDPYFPNQGNGGWIEQDPDKDLEELMEEEPEEEPQEDSEEDLKVEEKEQEDSVSPQFKNQLVINTQTTQNDNAQKGV